MTGEYSTDLLLDALGVAAVAAWDVPKIIEDTAPPTYDAIGTLPYAQICPLPLTASLSGEGSTVLLQYERNRFKVFYRFSLPEDPAAKVTRICTAAAQAFRAQVQANAEFAVVGLFPLITNVDWKRLGSPAENQAEVTIDFECYTQSPHH